MNKLAQLCLLTPILIFLCSCSRLVTPDYDTVDSGTITAIDKAANILTIQSFQSGTSQTWFVDCAGIDSLSLNNAEYWDELNLGDTVYIYCNKGNIFASKCSLKDACAINTALSDYYWHNLGKQWYWILPFIIILACITVYCKTTFLSFLAITAGWAVFLYWSNTNSTLDYVSEGTITCITPDYVELNDSSNVPYATLDDIATHIPVSLGEKVSVYNYRPAPDKNEMLFSTRKLNQEALYSKQAYPEIFMNATVLYFAGIIIMRVPLVYIKNRRKTKKRQKNA